MRDPLSRQLYVLDGTNPVSETDLVKWSEWMSSEHNRRVRLTLLGPCEVNTVFLGFDHGHGLTPRPLLFETMAFEAGETEIMRRVSTHGEAMAAHQEVVELVAELTTPTIEAAVRAIARVVERKGVEAPDDLPKDD